MKPTLIFILFLSSITFPSIFQIEVGDTFKVDGGYGDITGMSGGHTSANKIVDSIYSFSDSMIVVFNDSVTKHEYFFENGGVMRPLFVKEKTCLTVNYNKPPLIINHSSTFNNCKWIIGNQSDAIFYENIYRSSECFTIPIFDSSMAFQDNDFFLSRPFDTLGIIWRRDSIDIQKFNGQFVKYSNKDDSVGVLIKATEDRLDPYPSICYSGNNPFNILKVTMSTFCQNVNPEILPAGEGFFRYNIISFNKLTTEIKIKKQFHNYYYANNPINTFYNLQGKRISNKFTKKCAPQILISTKDINCTKFLLK